MRLFEKYQILRMIIGILKEIKNNENRVALIPEKAKLLTAKNHQVLVEFDAGIGSGYTNQDYELAGCKIIQSSNEIFLTSDIVLKVKEPLESEYKLLNNKTTLFTYLHLAANNKLTNSLLNAGTTAIAYENVSPDNKNFPLLKPMSEIAGKLAPQIASNFLQKQNGGLGVLIGGTETVPALKIGVIGAGTVGYNAASIALGMQANVYVFDIDEEKLLNLNNNYPDVNTVLSNQQNLNDILPLMDVIINGIYIPGASAPKIIDQDLLQQLKNNCLIVDVAIDQGGSVENLTPTSHDDPIVNINQVYGYAVPNMPGVVPRTASKALNEATFPYIEYLANNGVEHSIKNNNEIANGVNTYKNKLTSKPVADSLNLNFSPLDELI